MAPPQGRSPERSILPWRISSRSAGTLQKWRVLGSSVFGSCRSLPVVIRRSRPSIPAWPTRLTAAPYRTRTFPGSTPGTHRSRSFRAPPVGARSPTQTAFRPASPTRAARAPSVPSARRVSWAKTNAPPSARRVLPATSPPICPRTTACSCSFGRGRRGETERAAHRSARWTKCRGGCAVPVTRSRSAKGRTTASCPCAPGSRSSGRALPRPSSPAARSPKRW